MNLFWGSHSDSGENRESVVIEIEKLCRRLKSTLVEHQRSAVDGLKRHAERYQLEVGTIAMDPLIDLLREFEIYEEEFVSNILETLGLILRSNVVNGADIGVQFSDMFLRNNNNFSLLIRFLSVEDLYIRISTIRILLSCSINRSKLVQNSILKDPLSLSKLIDMLDEQEEPLRNEVLLLFINISSVNVEIQKILAFGNMFEKLFNIIEEIGVFNSIVVFDCFVLIKNMLGYNKLNHNYFIETGFIERLGELLVFDLESFNDESKNNTKIEETFIIMFDILVILIFEDSPSVIIIKEIIGQSQILDRLVNFIYIENQNLVSHSFHTIGNLISGHSNNQERFSNIRIERIDSEDDKMSNISIILILLHKSFDRKEDILIRQSCIYLFECYLRNNREGQIAISSTFIPTPSLYECNRQGNMESSSVGHLIMKVLMDKNMIIKDPMCYWFALMYLSIIIFDNKESKRIVINTNIKLTNDNIEDNVDVNGVEENSLLEYFISMIENCNASDSVDEMIEHGLVIVLIVWMYGDVASVTHIIKENRYLQYIIELIRKPLYSINNISNNLGLIYFLYGILVKFNDDEIEEFTGEKLMEILVLMVNEGIVRVKLNNIKKSYIWEYSFQNIMDDPLKMVGNEFYVPSCFQELLKTSFDDIKGYLLGKVYRNNILSKKNLTDIDARTSLAKESDFIDDKNYRELYEKLYIEFTDLKNDQRDLLDYLDKIEEENEYLKYYTKGKIDNNDLELKKNKDDAVQIDTHLNENMDIAPIIHDTHSFKEDPDNDIR